MEATHAISRMSAYDALNIMDTVLRKIMCNPEVQQQHKAKLVGMGIDLNQIRREYMPKMLPLDPATLPQGHVHTFSPVSGLTKGRLLDWEQGSEVTL